MNFKAFRIFSLSALLACAASLAAQTIQLNGEWTATLPGEKPQAMQLPGTLDMAGIGQPDTLQPAMTKPQLLRLTRKHSYIGPCTYARTIDITPDMAGKPLRLTMERVLWKSSLKVDGKPVGTANESLTTPHHFNISPLSAGPHKFEISVDNSRQHDISVDNLCHSYTNDTQTMWNGVLGDFTLTVVPAVELEAVRITPDIATGNVTADITVANATSGTAKRKIAVEIIEKNTGRKVAAAKASYKAPAGTSTFSTTLHLDNPSLWSEFSPALYELKASTTESSVESTFGMRRVESDGKNLRVNGNRIFLRGTLECCIFPLTGVPPTDKAGWRKVMETARQWGFNHLRFHSWCPPEAAFAVADSLGLYLQVELPVWSLHIGDDPATISFLTDEFMNMSRSYGNHPSWIMSTCGNELQHDFTPLNNLVALMRRHDPRHLYAASSFTFEKGHGGHGEPNDQFLITQWTDDGWVRGQGVFDEEAPAFNRNYASAMGCVKVPLVSHEIGQYAVYPNLGEIEKYTGVLDPLNFKAIRNDLEAKGLIDRAPAYLDATARFAYRLYKEEMERAMKTPGFSGVQLLGIQDFPGQGTALVGLIDAFWDSKGVISGEEFSSFNAPVIPLADFPKAIYTSHEPFSADIKVANYGDSDLKGKTLEWTLTATDGKTVSGTIAAPTLVQGEVTPAGNLTAALEAFAAPSKLTLSVRIPDTDIRNSWDIWVYPELTGIDKGEIVVTSLTDEASAALALGKKVLFLPAPTTVNGIESKFLPVFWSPVHFPKQAGGMGVLADASHLALAGFPNDGHSDWQWWRPVKNARIMLMDSVTDCSTGKHIDPVVGAIDNFLHNRRLGYMFEAKCGNGTLLVSSIDLQADYPEIKSLYQGVLRYMNSPAFSPEGTISEATLRSLVTSDTPAATTTSTSIYE